MPASEDRFEQLEQPQSTRVEEPTLLCNQMKSISRANAFAFFVAEAVRHFSDEELRFFPDCALPSHFLVYLGLQESFS
jgi:hypothetical protein